MARGGYRPGAGQKKSEARKLKEQSIRENHGEAERSLRFLIEVRDNRHEPTSLRVTAATLLMDRIWGKAKESVEHSGNVGCRMVLVHPK